MPAETDAAASTRVPARKRGNALGFWFFRTCARLLGLRGAYPPLYPVCLYYLLFDRAAVASAMAYVSRRFRSDGYWRRMLHVYRLFVSQGKQMIDRYAHLSSPGAFTIRLRTSAEAQRLLSDKKQGLILLTAHVGSWQVAMSELGAFDRPVYLVMRPEDNPAVQKTLRLDQEGGGIRLIPPGDDIGSVIQIMEALRQGHIVSIMGDRVYGFASVPVEFLGDQAQFPCGAFSIAAAAGCPIVVLLSANVGTAVYEVDTSRVLHPVYGERRKKREQLQAWTQEYARILEEFVQKHPYQCFLFHDSWKSASHPQS